MLMRAGESTHTSIGNLLINGGMDNDLKMKSHGFEIPRSGAGTYGLMEVLDGVVVSKGNHHPSTSTFN